MSISLNNVNYKINNKTILQNINLSLKQGVYGILGLNGAGKTTLLNVISTLTKPQNGSLSYNNTDVVKNPLILRKDLSYMPQNFGLIPDLTVVQNLMYFGMLKGVSSKTLKENIPNVLEFFNIQHTKETNVKNLSGGTQQRVALSLALVNDPKVLILDEPTSALDPIERINFYELIKKISDNSIVIVSSHNIYEIEKYVDNIIVLRNGQISFADTVDQLIPEAISGLGNSVSENSLNLEKAFEYFAK
ncbi:ABC transporter ATP-binding protein [Chryseobacterium polytrichastri]|uniref:ABC-2 type transport system ATP-binding protein n=1 Tax=Chryseobacterium polytrichastri TaxID=1302687 RepID=A0A1M6U9D8_9FLAO|nr:ABC transporter ATP-binding protein [Chryseobacterium polytrichastri]SHK65862.1 ABC-2 type transport system ATP-binding protein [Chryseobacterium polytrichastri]